MEDGSSLNMVEQAKNQHPEKLKKICSKKETGPQETPTLDDEPPSVGKKDMDLFDQHRADSGETSAAKFNGSNIELSGQRSRNETKMRGGRKKLNSMVWNFMKIIEGDLIECQICQTTYKRHRTSVTSNLLKHIRRCHPSELAAHPTYEQDKNLDVDLYADEFDEDVCKLIELVRLAPEMYVFDRIQTDDNMDMWDDVASNMGKSYMSGIYWKKRWHLLLSKYKKCARSIVESNGSQESLDAARQWKYFMPLEFLKPLISLPYYDMQSNETNHESDYVKSDVGEQATKLQCVGKSGKSKRPAKRPKLSTPHMSTKSPIGSWQHKNKFKQAFSSNQIPDSSTKQLAVKTSKDAHRGAIDTRSDVQHFFDSCARRMEGMDRQMQYALQTQILQLFDNFENLNFPVQSLTPVPPIQSAVASPKRESILPSEGSSAHDNQRSTCKQSNGTFPVDAKTFKTNSSDESSDGCEDLEVSIFPQNELSTHEQSNGTFPVDDDTFKTNSSDESSDGCEDLEVSIFPQNIHSPKAPSDSDSNSETKKILILPHFQRKAV